MENELTDKELIEYVNKVVELTGTYDALSKAATEARVKSELALDNSIEAQRHMVECTVKRITLGDTPKYVQIEGDIYSVRHNGLSNEVVKIEVLKS